MTKVRLPPFATLKANYPTDSDGNSVKKAIGGETTQAWLGDNTCVIRMSQAFNYAGKIHEIPRSKHMLTVRGKDNKNYAVRVQEFIQFLNERYGKPEITKYGSDINVNDFLRKTGLIAWHIAGWNDATGHFTLWDGSAGLYEGDHNYFLDFPTTPPSAGQPRVPYLTEVDLWIC
jgi:hypothetical protein